MLTRSYELDQDEICKAIAYYIIKLKNLPTGKADVDIYIEENLTISATFTPKENKNVDSN